MCPTIFTIYVALNRLDYKNEKVTFSLLVINISSRIGLIIRTNIFIYTEMKQRFNYSDIKFIFILNHKY